MDEDILLHCNLCPPELRLFTDELWLRTIKGRDYLACAWHPETRDVLNAKKEEPNDR